MDVKGVEELLRQYAEQLPEERIFPEEVARQLRAQLKPSSAADPEEAKPRGHDDESPLGDASSTQ
jgi:hypothetical protein